MSFFTIESNLLAVVVLLVGVVLDPQLERWAYVRGAATLYMAITGIVYAALLANEEVAPGGYGRVALFAVVLAVVMALLAVTVNVIGRERAGSVIRPVRISL